MIAHVSGLPVEELLPALMGGGGAWVILRLTSLGRWQGPRRRSPTDRPRRR